MFWYHSLSFHPAAARESVRDNGNEIGWIIRRRPGAKSETDYVFQRAYNFDAIHDAPLYETLNAMPPTLTREAMHCAILIYQDSANYSRREAAEVVQAETDDNEFRRMNR